MRIQLCKVGLRGAGCEELVETLRSEGHEVTSEDCMDRCSTCDLGGMVGKIEGHWVAAGNARGLRKRIAEAAELAADD
jgi:hypothetical protein